MVCIQEDDDYQRDRDDVRTPSKDFKMIMLRTSRETKVSVLRDRLGNPLGRAHAGRPANLSADDEREPGNATRGGGRWLERN